MIQFVWVTRLVLDYAQPHPPTLSPTHLHPAPPTAGAAEGYINVLAQPRLLGEGQPSQPQTTYVHTAHIGRSHALQAANNMRATYQQSRCHIRMYICMHKPHSLLRYSIYQIHVCMYIHRYVCTYVLMYICTYVWLSAPSLTYLIGMYVRTYVHAQTCTVSCDLTQLETGSMYVCM